MTGNEKKHYLMQVSHVPLSWPIKEKADWFLCCHNPKTKGTSQPSEDDCIFAMYGLYMFHINGSPAS